MIEGFGVETYDLVDGPEGYECICSPLAARRWKWSDIIVDPY